MACILRGGGRTIKKMWIFLSKFATGSGIDIVILKFLCVYGKMGQMGIKMLVATGVLTEGKGNSNIKW